MYIYIYIGFKMGVILYLFISNFCLMYKGFYHHQNSESLLQTLQKL